MMLVNPYMFGMPTVIDYQFNGTDYATTTTDSTGNTTCSGLGVVSDSSYAYIQSNNLLQARKNVTIDNSGALSPFLTFEGDFEIEIRNKFVDPYAFFAENILKLTSGGAYYFDLTIFATGMIGFSYTGSSGFTIEGYGAAINVYQTYKLKRVAGLLSLYIDDVLKGSVYNTSVMNGGRISLLGTDGDRYVDYLTIKKA
jgi:hypothetical protein